jgi:LysM repeat protein
MLRNLLIFVFIICYTVLHAQYPTGTNYIEQYKMIAISEMKRTGIPASIKLGQAILESAAGTSKLAAKANNHFGIKCGSNWNGDSYGLRDDERVLLFFKKKSCFRKYNNAEESFIDHSEFIRRPNGPYQSLFTLNPKDYKAWAKGLKKAGYATADDYPQKLIGVIERYQLYLFDGINSDSPVSSPSPEKPVVASQPKPVKAPLFKEVAKPIRINMVKAFIAKGGEKIEDVAQTYETPISYIMKYNDFIQKPNQVLNQNDIVYLQQKKKSFWGKKKIHYVTTGETMFLISQQYGIREDKLRERNMLTAASEPMVGQQIFLRGKRPKKDQLKTFTPIDKDSSSNFQGPIVSKREMEPGKQSSSQVVTNKSSQPLHSNEVNGVASDLLDFYVVPQEKKLDTSNATRVDSTLFKPVITGAELPASNSELPVISKPTQVQESAINEKLKVQEVKLAEQKFHIVDKGDTLYNISKRYGITVAKIKELNQLASDNITLGQKLIIQNE